MPPRRNIRGAIQCMVPLVPITLHHHQWPVFPNFQVQPPLEGELAKPKFFSKLNTK